MDCSPPGSPVRGISQMRILDWVAISFSKNICNAPVNRLKFKGHMCYIKNELIILKKLTIYHILRVKPGYSSQWASQVAQW